MKSYSHLRGHDDFCRFVQTISFDRLGDTARLYCTDILSRDEPFSCFYRLRDAFPREAGAQVRTELSGYDGPMGGRRAFVIQRLSKLVGDPKDFPLESCNAA